MLQKAFYTLIIFSTLALSSHAKELTVSGEAVYTKGEQLPKDARLEVLLEDISRADALAETMAKTVIQPVGEIPISFSLGVDDANITLGHRYAVRATLKSKGKLLYTTDTFYSVFAGGKEGHLHLVLKYVGKVPESRKMEGMYSYLADAALFKDCVTGKFYPVAFEADNRALEEAYLKDSNGSGAPMKVELQGKIVKRPKMEGKGTTDTLFVERFIRLEGKKDCKEQQLAVPISNNYWKLKRLYGEAAQTTSGAREAHILLRQGLNGAGELKVVTPCDTLTGHYKIDENSLHFQINTPDHTMPECTQQAEAQRFLSALSHTDHWRIEGEELTLFDEMNQAVAHFQAVYF